MGISREFGRRSLAADEQFKAASLAAAEEDGEPGGVSSLLIQFVVVACLTFGGAGLYFVLSQPGPPQATARVIPVNNTPVPPSDLEEVHRACSQAMDNAGEIERANAMRGMMDMNIVKTGIGAALKLSAANLNCLMNHTPRRLCNKADLKDFVASVHEHLVIVKAGPAMSAMAEQSIARAREMANKGGGLLYPGNDAPIVPMGPITAFDEQITYGLRNLASGGIIKPEDFAAFWGSVIPSDVTRAIEGVKVIRRECPGQAG